MMILNKKLAGTIIMLCVTTCCWAQKKSATNLQKELKEIMAIWPGKFNNDQQIAEVKNAGGEVWSLGKGEKSGKGGYLQLESHYIKLDNPAIGENVLYVEEYRDHQPDSTYRQRIYTLSIDEGAGIIRVKMWPFKDKKKYIGAWKNPGLLAKLTIEEITAYPDKCDLLVKKEGDKYNMYMNGKDCAFGDKCFNYQVLLSKDMFSYRDKITSLSSGAVLTTAAEFAYHNLNRIK